jgi:3-hydroxyacyl-CoA dehydrogenase/3a,7a,12a-trihydroxy-5b-cholest-24-enoyl-CoA hydratase
MKKGAVGEGETVKPDCTLAISDADFMDMCTGKADPQKLYFGGKLKISGNVMASQKLTFLQKINPDDHVEAVMAARAARGSGGGAAKAAAAPAKGPSVSELFEKLKTQLGANPGLVAEVSAVMQWQVGDSSWVVDMKNGSGKVESGSAKDADVVFTISADDLGSLVKGDDTVRNMYQHGQLRVDGDVLVAQRLGFLKSLA